MYLSGSSARNVPYEDLDVFVVTERLPKVDPITKKSVEDLTRRDNTKSID